MSLYSELKDRKVIRVAAVYLVVAWLIMQVVAVVSEPLLLPDWFARVVILLLTIGFPLAIILSWAFDATPAEGSDNRSGKPLAIGLIAATAIVIGFIVTGFNSGDSEPEAVVAVEAMQERLPNSVAVLLCDNLSPDENDAYFAAGIHEEILNQLVKLSALNVIARTSVLQYADDPPPIPQIAEELNVGSVMECSVRFAGTSIMVTAQLIDPVTNSHLWSETYPGDIGDLTGVFAMQADIATNIANALHAEFSQEEQAAIETIHTDSPEAYAAYLLALSTPRGSDRLDLLNRAIAADPNFALAYARKAETLSQAIAFGEEDGIPFDTLALETAETALSLDPNLAYAHAVLGRVYEVRLNAVEAEGAHRRAYQISPNDTFVLMAYARFKRNQGDYSEAVSLIEQAAKLDPKASGPWNQLGLTHLFAGNATAGLSALEKFFEIVPGTPTNILSRANAHYQIGDMELAEVYVRMSESLQTVSLNFSGANLALAYERLGAQEDVDRLYAVIKEQLPDDATPNIYLVIVYAAAHEFELAYEELARVVNSEELPPLNIISELKVNRWQLPAFEEPRFVELLDQLGFQD